jgi:hypothetical protein
MRSMRKCLAALILALGCAGEPFIGAENEITVGRAGFSNGGSEQSQSAGSPGTSGRRATNHTAGAGGMQLPILPAAGSGGNTAGSGGDTAGAAGNNSGSSGSSGSGGAEPETLCRIDGVLCQCYSDPSVFEAGWLNVAHCPASTRCTSRDDSACVCWDTDAAYTSALMNGFVAEKECPSGNIQ